jgi:hypothetical protein
MPPPARQSTARGGSPLPRADSPSFGAGHRQHAESLLRGLEVLVERLANPALPLPLDLLSRYERALVDGHRSNLLRLTVIEERLLAQPEEVHD